MSQPQKTEQKDNKKNKVTQVDKKNTDAWKQKQAQKKKQKEGQQSVQPQVETKQDKKQKKKKEKGKQEQKQQKTQQTKDKKTQQKNQTKTQTLKKDLIKYKKLETVDTLIVPKYPSLLQNRIDQVQLIQKQILNLIRPGDTILYLGKNKLEDTTKISAGCGKNNYRVVQISGFTQHKNSQIICRYEDISYLISQQIDKIFIEAVTIFQNGSVLVPKGYQNIILLCKMNNKPIVINTGSWNYIKISISNYQELQSLYGEQIVNSYDWIDQESIDLVCMEFGAVLPSQISYQVQQGYKNFGFGAVKW